MQFKELPEFEIREHFYTMHVQHILPMKERLERLSFGGHLKYFFLPDLNCISFFLFAYFPFELT